MCSARSLTTESSTHLTGGEEDNTLPHLRQCATVSKRSFALFARPTTAESCQYLARLAAVSSRKVRSPAGCSRDCCCTEMVSCRWQEGSICNASDAGRFCESGKYGKAGSPIIDGRTANQASGFRDGSAATLVAERQKLPRTFFDQLQTATTLVQGRAAIGS